MRAVAANDRPTSGPPPDGETDGPDGPDGVDGTDGADGVEPADRADAIAASRWVRLPQQQRARRTIERVLDAGAELLAESGYAGFSISEVCRRSAVSPGALYERIDGGKDALFLAIHERELARMTAGINVFIDGARWSALSSEDLVTEVVHELGRHYLGDERLLKVFILRAAVDERTRIQGSAAGRRLEMAVTSLLLRRAKDYPHPDPSAAVLTAYRVVVDSLSWRIAFGVDHASVQEQTAQDWLERLTAVARGYLLGPPG